MTFTEIITEDELREAIGGYATGRAATLEELEAHYAPEHYSTLLY
jgi:hypothetical protein